MNSYLGIDHHRLGPPPNWRDYRKGLFGLRFDRERYIHDVEMYIQKTHAWHFHIDITDYDELNAEIGESAVALERQLKGALKVVERFARRWDSVKTPEESDAYFKAREERWHRVLGLDSDEESDGDY